MFLPLADFEKKGYGLKKRMLWLIPPANTLVALSKSFLEVWVLFSYEVPRSQCDIVENEE
jgi:hypothetical protein